ncbi:MAG: group II truncated hemoglobin [Deltaproteobacteria bacterium]|nr:group II truncated hemoglobin [Deltaproteobacteria bacterium]
MALEVRPSFGAGDSSFRAAGGAVGLERLVDDFYRIMGEAPEARVIRAMHPDDLTESRDKLARFLCGWLGGPRRYAEKYGSISIPGVHAHLAIDEPERDAWLVCMERAIALQGYEPSFGEYLLAQLGIPAQRIFLTCQEPS